MSEEQKEWRLELAQHKDSIHSQIGSILDGLAKSFSELKVQTQLATGSPSTSLSHKLEVAIQTEEDASGRTNSNGVVPSTGSLSNGMASMDIVQSPPQQPSTPQKVSLDVEALRAQLAHSIGQITSQESLIRSLEISIVELRRDNDTLLKQLEEKAVEIRKHEASMYTQVKNNNRLASDLNRAGSEVERLRASIEMFHKPSTLVYQSIKDAVLRELRGEQPLNTMFRGYFGTTNANEADGRPHKRPRTQGSGSNNTSQPHSPQSHVQQSPAQTQRLPLVQDVTHPQQIVGSGVQPSMPAARDVRPDVVHRHTQDQIGPSSGAAPSLKRPRENTISTYPTTPFTHAALSAVNGTRPGHRPNRSWSIDGAPNHGPSVHSQVSNQTQPKPPPPPTVLYRLDPPPPGQQYPTAVPVYQIPTGETVVQEMAHPDKRPRAVSSSTTHPSKPGDYEFSQVPPTQFMVPNMALGNNQGPRESMRPPTTVTQPTTGELVHPSRDARGPAPSGMPQPAKVPQPPLRQQTSLGGASSRTGPPPIESHGSHGQPTTGPNDQTQLVPFLLHDSYAYFLASKLYERRIDGQKTYLQCYICGFSGQLSIDFKAFFTHSMTVHREAFDAAYKNIFHETVVPEQPALQPPPPLPTGATGNTTTSR